MYHFRFQAIWPFRDALISGAISTLLLSVVALVIGLVIGTACAVIRLRGPRWSGVLVVAYVEVIRNTPLFVQCLLLFFGLPSLGVRLGALEVSIIALSVNFAAYASEIIRAGIESIPRQQVEAGLALAFTRLQVLKNIILPPALRNVFPALSSQFVILMLGSSVVSQISSHELFYEATLIDSQTFLSFEVYGVVTAIYFVLAVAMRLLLKGLYLASFGRWR